jgi:hypothetical protein
MEIAAAVVVYLFTVWKVAQFCGFNQLPKEGDKEYS